MLGDIRRKVSVHRSLWFTFDDIDEREARSVVRRLNEIPRPEGVCLDEDFCSPTSFVVWFDPTSYSDTMAFRSYTPIVADVVGRVDGWRFYMDTKAWIDVPIEHTKMTGPEHGLLLRRIMAMFRSLQGKLPTHIVRRTTLTRDGVDDCEWTMRVDLRDPTEPLNFNLDDMKPEVFTKVAGMPTFARYAHPYVGGNERMRVTSMIRADGRTVVRIQAESTAQQQQQWERVFFRMRAFFPRLEEIVDEFDRERAERQARCGVQ